MDVPDASNNGRYSSRPPRKHRCGRNVLAENTNRPKHSIAWSNFATIIRFSSMAGSRRRRLRARYSLAATVSSTLYRSHGNASNRGGRGCQRSMNTSENSLLTILKVTVSMGCPDFSFTNTCIGCNFK
jgi:hypothetical protein